MTQGGLLTDAWPFIGINSCLLGVWLSGVVGWDVEGGKAGQEESGRVLVRTYLYLDLERVLCFC